MGIKESIDAVVAKAPQRPEGIAHCNIDEVRAIVGAASLVFEIGAYNGFDVPVIHRCWPNAAIHCFEPDPESFARLKEFEGEFVVCNQMALSNKVGTVPFFRVLDSKIEDQAQRSEWFKTAGSLLHNGPLHYGASPALKEQELQVPCMTVDQYCADHKVQPDIMLVDTQGSEYQILEGAVATLPRVKIMMLEWSKAPLYDGQKYLDDIVAFLKSFKFELVREINLWSNIHGDAVFVNRS